MDRRRTFPAMIRNRLEEPAPESLDAVNLSTAEVEVDEMIEAIREGSMPPWQYKPTTPEPGCPTREARDSRPGGSVRSRRCSG
jgi:hypothetical protein